MNHDDRKRQEEWDTAMAVVVFAFIVSVPVFFLLMSAREATQATAIFLSGCVLIMGTGAFFFKPKRPAKVKRERAILTEAEFDFLATGVPHMGLVEARPSDDEAWRLAQTLVDKGLLKPAAGFQNNGVSVYRCWSMTSRGVDAALGAFDPAPGWYPFGNPDKRKI